MNFDFSKVDWFVVGISGGKDSTGTLLYLLYEFFPQHNISTDKLLCTFADHGNEDEGTYEQIKIISERLHPVITLKPDLDFFELAYHKKRFPDPQKRFCTQILKLEPAKRFMETLEGNVLSVSGVRKEESKKRAKYTEFASAFETYHGFTEWRPLLDWKIEDVFLIHKKYNFPLNPRYALGFSRVGCRLCIMSRKREVRLTARLFPEHIDIIREKENNFPNRVGFYQYFPKNMIPERYRSRTYTDDDGTVHKLGSIDDVVAWSKTSDRKRSSNYDFHYEDYELALDEEEPACMSGVCE